MARRKKASLAKLKPSRKGGKFPKKPAKSAPKSFYGKPASYGPTNLPNRF